MGDADPREVGGFRVVGRLGQGGMGVVYLAERSVGGATQRVALKIVRQELATNTAFRQRFAREARAAMAVSGLCTARVIALDIDSDPQWLATEYVPGPTLEGVVTQTGPLPPDQATALAVGLVEAVRAMGTVGVVHRDIKPANVILGPTGPALIDLGIAHALEATSLTTAGLHVGSPGWMAPEQITGTAESNATDMFGWASTVAYAALGRHPFGTGRPEALTWRILNQPPDLTGIAAVLLEPISQSLALDPGARPDPAEVLDALGISPAGAVAVSQFLGAVWKPPIDSTAGQVFAGAPSAPAATHVIARPPAKSVDEGQTSVQVSSRSRSLPWVVGAALVAVAAMLAGGVVIARSAATGTPATGGGPGPSSPPSPSQTASIASPSPTSPVAVRMVSSNTRPMAGSKVTLTATVRPVLPGQAIAFQASTGSGWVDVAQATTNTLGRASAEVAATDNSGTINYRAVFRDRSRTVKLTSPTVTLRLTRAPSSVSVDWPTKPIPACAQETITARVSPIAAGRTVILQSSDTEEVWGDVVQDTTGPKGIAQLPLPKCDTTIGSLIGSQRWRVVVNRSPAYQAAESTHASIPVQPEGAASGACTSADTEEYVVALDALNSSSDPEVLDSAQATVDWYRAGCGPR